MTTKSNMFRVGQRIFQHRFRRFWLFLVVPKVPKRSTSEIVVNNPWRWPMSRLANKKNAPHCGPRRYQILIQKTCYLMLFVINKFINKKHGIFQWDLHDTCGLPNERKLVNQRCQDRDNEFEKWFITVYNFNQGTPGHMYERTGGKDLGCSR